MLANLLRRLASAAALGRTTWASRRLVDLALAVDRR
jgi:hypothetical protein